MKSLSKLGKTIMKVANINLNFRKMKNNDKKAATPPSRHTSTLKAVPLAVLMALNTGTLATDATCKPNENNLTVTTEVVSNTKSPQQTKETISPEDQKDYDKLYCMMFLSDVRGESIYLKKTDKVSIGIVKDQYDPETGKRLGDAILIKYKHPENKKEYESLKNAGLKPEATDYPITETYLIPITNEGVRVDAKKNLLLEDIGEERCAKLKVSKNCFKWEEYPDIVCEMNSMGYVSTKDGLKYFNYNKDGWHGSTITGMDRCGMTKEIFVSVEDALMVVNCMEKHYSGQYITY